MTELKKGFWQSANNKNGRFAGIVKGATKEDLQDAAKRKGCVVFGSICSYALPKTEEQKREEREREKNRRGAD